MALLLFVSCVWGFVLFVRCVLRFGIVVCYWSFLVSGRGREGFGDGLVQPVNSSGTGSVWRQAFEAGRCPSGILYLG